MSLPGPIANKIKEIPMDPIALANNMELAYMLSFSSYQISNESIQCSPRENYHSPLSDFNFVEFDEKVYDELYNETKKNYEHKNLTVVKSIRNSFKEYFTRVSAMTYAAALNKQIKLQQTSINPLKLPSYQQEYKIDQMRGNNPAQWPKNLKDFYLQICKLPWNAFSSEPIFTYDQFLRKAEKSLRNILNIADKDNREDFLENITMILEIIIGISLKTCNQTFILKQLFIIAELGFNNFLKEEEQASIMKKLQELTQKILEQIPVIEEQEYHMPKKLWQKGEAFMIMKKIHFQKQNGLGFFSVTTDGTYLYIYISAINGGMYKVGTGYNSSIAGKIYFQKQMFLPVGSKLEQINWVYLKGKLYLKSSCRDPYIIEVVNPQNFQVQSTIELRCEGLFGHQALINLNRNSILLSDGENLFFLGKQLKITQNKEDSNKKQRIDPQPVKEQSPDSKLKKKKRKKQPNNEAPPIQTNNNEPVEKVVQFVLCEYNIQKKPKEPESDEKLVEQLYQSFNNFFTRNQCRRALDICDQDMSYASQWLVEHGQKQRKVNIFYPEEKIIIGQAEITNNFNEKSLKGSNDLATKDGSILHIQNINESMWTMDKDEVTCYSEVGIKIFSKSSSDSHNLSGTDLQTTHIKTSEGKFSRNPDYSIVYDPYNMMFFVYTWPIEGGHYFPTAVLIGSDYKSAVQLTFQKKLSVNSETPKNSKQFSKWALLSMNLLDNNHCPDHGRVNDWMWFFAQKIIELNKKINDKNDTSDKKKLSNKRSKILAKMNKVNEYYKIYQNERQQIEKKGRIVKQIFLIQPFGTDGTLQNLRLIRKIFGDKIAVDEMTTYIIALQGWLSNSPNIIPPQISDYLEELRIQLNQLKERGSQRVSKSVMRLFIEYFYLFFPSSFTQEQFILSLSQEDLKLFMNKNKIIYHRNKKTITYEITKKQLLILKFDSKSKFDELFLVSSNIFSNPKIQSDSIGNLLLDKTIKKNAQKTQNQMIEKSYKKKDRKVMHAFLQKIIGTGETGLKFFETLFLEAFRLLIINRDYKVYLAQLQSLFQLGFNIIQKALNQSALSSMKNISQSLLLVLQLYFSSLCSLSPSSETLNSLIRVVESLNKKDLKALLQLVEEADFEGISQTCEKIYQTPHPLERGKNQNFSPFKVPEALLIMAQFDKRCQSDVNHDIMQIQITHEGSPVGNSINCTDGVFSANLRMTGKVETKKPYLIMGNSVTVDFSSSGHAKDAKSFGRYGFKFGLRPIFSGKLRYKKEGIQLATKIFGSKANFQRYVNTLKLAVVVTSDGIERLTYLQRKKKSSEAISKILNGKIFREGYEEDSQNHESYQNKEEQIILQFLKEQNITEGRNIVLKNLHKNQCLKRQNQENKLKQIKIKQQKQIDTIQSRDKLWTFDGIPTYIKVYLQKIKDFNGDFIDLFKQARKLAPPKLNFANQLRRQGFTQQYKQLWLQGQALLFLTVLKHSGLLHLNLKFSIQYIKENLKAFQEARTGIFQSFINRMQIVRQWNHLVQEFHREPIIQQKTEEIQKQEPPSLKTKMSIKRKGMSARTVNLDRNTYKKKQAKKEQKVEKQKQQASISQKKQTQKLIRERLTQNYMIKAICNLKNIQYIPEEPYDNVSRIIAELEKEKCSKFESVYIQPMNRLIKSCLFLLRIKSPSTQQNLNNGDNLVPQAVTRSLSSDNRNANSNKVNLFRQWLENWKKWKDFKKEGKVQLKFPVSDIVDFVNSWIQIGEFQKEMALRAKKAEKRIKFYEFNYHLLKNTLNSSLNKYVIGSQVASIFDGYKQGLESVSSIKISQLQNCYKNYAKSLKEQQRKKVAQMPLNFQKFKLALAKQTPEFSLLEQLRLSMIHLYLISSENPCINIQTALFIIPFKHLTNNQQQLSFIASLIVQRAFLSEIQSEQLLKIIWREVGANTIASKRWKDYYFIERIIFLLRKLQIKTKERLQVGKKRKIAQILFYILYHIQVPIIIRISLRIMKKLQIDLKNRIETPFDVSYTLMKLSEYQIKCEKFKVENEKSYTNPQILATKCGQFFEANSLNKIKQKLINYDNSQEIEPAQPLKNNYHLFLNLQQEEQIAWMVQVFYYLQEIENKIVPIKDWDEYVQKKNKKKQQKEQKEQKQNLNAINNLQNDQVQINNQASKKKKICERMFQTLPINLCKVDSQIENTLPVGWFLNYCNIFGEFTNKKEKANLKSPVVPAQPLPGVNQKKSKSNQQINQNAGKKPWNPIQFIKLYKKFEQLTSKPLEQPKEDESQQNKAEFIKAKNFISRMRKHCSDVSLIMSNFSQIGYFIFREDISEEMSNKICQLFSLGAQNQLKQIPCDFKVKDYATKLSPAYAVSKKNSQFKILMVKSQKYKQFHQLITAPATLLMRLQNQSQFSYSNLNLTESVVEDKVILPYHQFLEIDFPQERQIQFGKQFIQSDISRMKMKHDEVILKDYPKLKYYISQGGLQSGMQQCTVVPAFDKNIESQTVSFDQIMEKSQNYEQNDEPEELIKKSIDIMESQFTQIKSKSDIKPYMLLTFYLKKIANIDLTCLPDSLVKTFGERLNKFTNNFKAQKSIQSYKQQIQILLLKLLDTYNKNLAYYRLYRFDPTKIEKDIQQFMNKSDKIEGNKEQKNIQNQTAQTHQYKKSNYLLPVHPPIPEENNLLKYWQKNILPKIHEFVKTTLRPIQVQDFFEQMRIPLRVGDQTQAKKIAYVICDNKLPQGAVLPDSNHNWNSLTIEEISVGMDVLIRLPKTRTDCSTPLLASSSQNYRFGQIIFIDNKNLSALVRHKIPQYGIFSYTWMPVNTLQAVQKSLAHYSKKSIFSQMELSLKGMIKNYSKICMTKMTSKIQLKTKQLIHETIIDIFRDNPISGWQQPRQWPLRNVLKKMLENKDDEIITKIQQNFCPLKSYQINLFSEEILSLNKFDNSLGLIVSFKKTASLIWYSGIKFYADEFGFKQINDVYASKTCINEIEPLQFNIPNVYCKYYSNKSCLKAVQQGKYDQKEIPVTIFSIDPIWTSSVYLGSAISDIAVQSMDYLDVLTRINKIYISWLIKKPPTILSAHLCVLIAKITRSIMKISRHKRQEISITRLGVTEQQLKLLIQWVSQLVSQEEKQIIILYSPLVQNLVQMISFLLSSLQKLPNLSIALPENIKETVKMIEMIIEIEQNLKGINTKTVSMKNQAQFERILVIENIPPYIGKNQLRNKFKQILQKNNGKILTPQFDIFYENNQAVILVDSWDVNELIQEEIMQKIEQQEEKEPEPQDGGGLLMEWECEICTYFNQAGAQSCQMCGSAAPAPKNQIVYEKVQSTDVNKAEKKLKEKEMKRFENIKIQITKIVDSFWEKECSQIAQKKIEADKLKDDKRRKKKKEEQEINEQLVKPQKPQIKLSSGSSILDKNIIQKFLELRYLALPNTITKNIQGQTYLEKFKSLMKVGYDLWGDNIACQTPTLLSIEYLSYLMEYIQDEICKGSSSVLSYSQQSIRIMKRIVLLDRQSAQEPINFKAENDLEVKMKYNQLAGQKSYNIRYSWKVIKQLNISASKCLNFINMKLSQLNSKEIDITNSIGANIKYMRRLIMGAIKLELFQKIMQKTSVSLESQQIPKISIERLKLKDEKIRTKGLISAKDKEQYIFTKAHEQLEKVSSINLRSFKPKGTQPYLSFGVTLKGEDVMGQAGPYRQFFTDISSELNPTATGLGLFIKTPNNLHKIGQSREKWTINPKGNTSYHLSLFEFLGLLMGCCIRTGCHMTIDLCDFCWKLIADEDVKDTDIDQFDRQFYEQIKQIIDCPSQDIFESLEEIVDQPVTWSYQTSDGEEKELIPNGKNQRVSYQDRIKYANLMKIKRIQQIKLQIDHIREGLGQMIPNAFLNHFSGQQLKTMICGVPKVNVQLLKKHTKYAGNLRQDSPIIQNFWRMMKELSEEQKLKLIKFCWGQERLPLNSQQFDRNGIRFMIKPMMNCRDPNQSLPKADTCFFNIQLPQYSSYQIMKERILMAVNLDCTSINGDQVMRADDNPLMGNVDYDEEQEQNEEYGGGGGG